MSVSERDTTGMAMAGGRFGGAVATHMLVNRGVCRRMLNAFVCVASCFAMNTESGEIRESFHAVMGLAEDCAVFKLDSAGRVASWNAHAEKLFGFTQADVLGQPLLHFYTTADSKSGRPQADLQEAAAKGQLLMNGWRVRKNRTQFWARILIRAVRQEGRLRGFAHAIRDITTSTYMEEILKRSEERTRLIVESMHDALISTDTNGIITDWNRQAERLFGWPRQQVLGCSIAEFFVDSTRRNGTLKRYDPVKRAQPLNQPLELLARHRDGRQFAVEAIMRSIPLGEGRMITFFLRDITERKNAEHLLKQLPAHILRGQEAERKRVAQELHDSVNQMLSSVKLRISGKADASIPGMTASLEVLDKCIDEVRRIARNLMPSELEDLGLMPAVRTLCEEFRNNGKIQLDLKYSGVPGTLRNDLKLSVFRVIQEALSNVEKHSQATSAGVTLTGTRSLLKVVIKDNGKGFVPPQRNGARTKIAGMGLLNMRERISSVGGKFEMQSVPAKGSVICIQVPIAGNGAS